MSEVTMSEVTMSEVTMSKARLFNTKDQAHSNLSREFDISVAKMANEMLAFIVDSNLEERLDELYRRMLEYFERDDHDMSWLLLDMDVERLERMCNCKGNGLPKLFMFLRHFLLQLAVVKKMSALGVGASRSGMESPINQAELIGARV